MNMNENIYDNSGAPSKYFEVSEDGQVTPISSPEEASPEAKWVIKEKYFRPMASLPRFYAFVNNEGAYQKVSISGVRVESMLMDERNGYYTLSFRLVDAEGNSREYILYNEIVVRESQPSLQVDMEWDMQNPVAELAKRFLELERIGLELFTEKYCLENKLHKLKRRYNRLDRVMSIMSARAANVDAVEIKEGVEILGLHAISDFPSLRKLVLPSSVTELRYHSLCSDTLREIYFKSTVPPKKHIRAFGDSMSFPELTIYVPKGTLEEYFRAWGFCLCVPKSLTFVEYDVNELR